MNFPKIFDVASPVRQNDHHPHSCPDSANPFWCEGNPKPSPHSGPTRNSQDATGEGKPVKKSDIFALESILGDYAQAIETLLVANGSDTSSASSPPESDKSGEAEVASSATQAGSPLLEYLVDGLNAALNDNNPAFRALLAQALSNEEKLSSVAGTPTDVSNESETSSPSETAPATASSAPDIQTNLPASTTRPGSRACFPDPADAHNPISEEPTPTDQHLAPDTSPGIVPVDRLDAMAPSFLPTPESLHLPAAQVAQTGTLDQASIETTSPSEEVKRGIEKSKATCPAESTSSLTLPTDTFPVTSANADIPPLPVPSSNTNSGVPATEAPPLSSYCDVNKVAAAATREIMASRQSALFFVDCNGEDGRPRFWLGKKRTKNSEREAIKKPAKEARKGTTKSNKSRSSLKRKHSTRDPVYTMAPMPTNDVVRPTSVSRALDDNDLALVPVARTNADRARPLRIKRTNPYPQSTPQPTPIIVTNIDPGFRIAVPLAVFQGCLGPHPLMTQDMQNVYNINTTISAGRLARLQQLNNNSTPASSRGPSRAQFSNAFPGYGTQPCPSSPTATNFCRPRTDNMVVPRGMNFSQDDSGFDSCCYTSYPGNRNDPGNMDDLDNKNAKRRCFVRPDYVDPSMGRSAAFNPVARTFAYEGEPPMQPLYAPSNHSLAQAFSNEGYSPSTHDYSIPDGSHGYSRAQDPFSVVDSDSSAQASYTDGNFQAQVFPPAGGDSWAQELSALCNYQALGSYSQPQESPAAGSSSNGSVAHSLYMDENSQTSMTSGDYLLQELSDFRAANYSQVPGYSQTPDYSQPQGFSASATGDSSLAHALSMDNNSQMPVASDDYWSLELSNFQTANYSQAAPGHPQTPYYSQTSDYSQTLDYSQTPAYSTASSGSLVHPSSIVDNSQIPVASSNHFPQDFSISSNSQAPEFSATDYSQMPVASSNYFSQELPISGNSQAPDYSQIPVASKNYLPQELSGKFQAPGFPTTDYSQMPMASSNYFPQELPISGNSQAQDYSQMPVASNNYFPQELSIPGNSQAPEFPTTDYSQIQAFSTTPMAQELSMSGNSQVPEFPTAGHSEASTDGNSPFVYASYVDDTPQYTLDVPYMPTQRSASTNRSAKAKKGKNRRPSNSNTQDLQFIAEQPFLDRSRSAQVSQHNSATQSKVAPPSVPAPRVRNGKRKKNLAVSDSNERHGIADSRMGVPIPLERNIVNNGDRYSRPVQEGCGQ